MADAGKAGLNVGTSPARSKVVDAQLQSLRTAVSQLRNAYNGQDVEFPFVSEENDFGGSGAGSGGSNYDEEDTDDTEGGDDRDDDETGSGMGEYDPMSGRSGGGSGSSSSTTTTSEQEPTSSEDLGTGHTGGSIDEEHEHEVEEEEEEKSHASSTSRPVMVVDPVNGGDVNVLGGGNSSSGGGEGDGGKVMVPQDPKTIVPPTSGTDTSSGSAATGQPQMSITRALVTYFLPIVMAFFGSAFSDLL